MKLNLKSQTRLKYPLGVLLILVSMLGASATIQRASAHRALITGNSNNPSLTISNWTVAQHDSALSDEDKIKATIDAYFALLYEGRTQLIAEDFSPLLDDNTLSWVGREKEKREIEIYIEKLFGLKYVDFRYTLAYDAIEIKNRKAIVHLRESNEVVAEATAPDVSRLGNLPHPAGGRHIPIVSRGFCIRFARHAHCPSAVWHGEHERKTR